MRSRYLDILINASFKEVNRLSVLSFKDEGSRESHILAVEIKDYTVIIDGKNFFDQPIKNDLKKYDNIRKIATGQGDDLLDYHYFKNYYKSIAVDLSKQQTLDSDPKSIQQINFTRNISRREGATMFFNIEEVKKIVLDLSKGTVKVL